MTDATPRCPWCSAELPPGAHESCPSCGATLLGPAGEPDIKGVTSLDPMAIIQARADVARPRNRIMSFITGDTPTEQDPTANAESLAPPDLAVRREMRRLEIEAERADLEAETVALKTDVVVEMGIPLSALGGADADLAQAAMADDEAAEVAAEFAAEDAPAGDAAVAAPSGTPPAASVPTPPPPARIRRRRCSRTRRRRRLGLRPAPGPPRILGSCPTASPIPARRSCASRRSASATADSRPAWRSPWTVPTTGGSPCCGSPMPTAW